MSKRQELFFRQIGVFCDVVVLLTSYAAAYGIRTYSLNFWYGTLYPFASYIWILWFMTPIWIFLLKSVQLYESESYKSLKRIIKLLAKVQILGGLILLSTMYLMHSEETSRLFLQLFLVISFTGLVIEKGGIKIVLDRLRTTQSPHVRKLLVVGIESQAERYFHLLRDHPHWGVEVIGFLAYGSHQCPEFCGRPVLGQIVDFAMVLERHVIDEVTAVLPQDGMINMERLAMACAERGVTFRILMDMPAAKMGKYNVEALGRGIYLLSLEMIPQEILPLVIKRLVDIIGASVGIALCSLLYIWYRRKLYHESPGPVLFRQIRIGKNGRLFTLYKFRTMYLDAEERLKELLAHNQMKGFIFKIKDDPRVTPTGHVLRRYHFDELPQCWNVLRGDMSLVGTRPPTPDELAQYLPYHRRRLSMKPGITGFWQLLGNETVDDFETIVKLDCEYIDNWSLWLDYKILAKTVLKVVRGNAW
jgi:exopolysaccharide biosynthesis polyprenyl glycosylphosphotransferase